jgi:membrane-associated phospholipid phosphatase
MKTLQRIAPCWLLLALPTALLAQNPTQPPGQSPLFGKRDLLALGLVLGGTAVLFTVDRPIAEGVQGTSFQRSARGMADMAAGIRSGSITGLAAAGGGAYLFGRLTGLREVADFGLHGAEAVILTQGLGLLIKGVTGRARPNVDITDPYDFDWGGGFKGTSHNSFPSTYAILTFSAASVIVAETSRWWPGTGVWVVGPLAYTAAGLVGFSRMYGNKHWASDVFLAAGVGSYVGWKVVQLHHSRPNNFIDRLLLPAVAPEPDGGVRLQWSLATR